MAKVNVVSGRPPFQSLRLVLPAAVGGAGIPRQYPSLIGTLQLYSASVDSADIEFSFDGAYWFNLPLGVKVFDFDAPHGFWVRNNNAAGQVVVVFVGQANVLDSRTIVGAVTPGVNLPVSAYGTSGAVGLGFLGVTDTPTSSRWAARSAAMGAGPATLLAAATNVNGAWIAGAKLIAGAAGEAAMYYAPLVGAGNGLELLYHLNTVGTEVNLMSPIYVPAGNGIFVVAIAGVAAQYLAYGTVT